MREMRKNPFRLDTCRTLFISELPLSVEIVCQLSSRSEIFLHLDESVSRMNFSYFVSSDFFEDGKTRKNLLEKTRDFVICAISLRTNGIYLLK